MSAQPVDDIDAKLARRVDQVLRVFVAHHSDAFVHGLGSQAGTAFHVVGGVAPPLAERVPQRIDAVLVMALPFAHPIAGGA